MSSDARQHHYLPQCYLRGFTKGGGKKSKLNVLDLKRQQIFETSPRNVGGCRDFNRVNIAGVSPNAVESGLSSFESNVATALRNFQQTRSLTGETKDYILNLIALLAIRSPQRREHRRKFQSEVVERMMDLMLASKENWERSTSKTDSAKDVSYEDVKAFRDSKRYSISVPTERHLAIEMDGVNVILPLLYRRKWLIVVSPDEASPFITTDHPVVLLWNHPEKIPPLYRQSPGFGMPDTTVQIALTKDIALLGEFEGKEGVLPANRELVAALNSRALMLTFEQVYAPTTSFVFLAHDQSLAEGRHLFSMFTPT